MSRLSELEQRLAHTEESGQERAEAAERLAAEKLELEARIEAGQLEATRLAAQLDLARLELEEKLKLGTKIQVGKLSTRYRYFQFTTVLVSVVDPDPNLTVFKTFVDPYSEYGSGSRHVNTL